MAPPTAPDAEDIEELVTVPLAVVMRFVKLGGCDEFGVMSGL
jgi:hypothetical protein